MELPDYLLHHLGESYISCMMIVGLGITMYINRHIKIPGNRIFAALIVMLLSITLIDQLEAWAAVDSRHFTLRVVFSILGYILKPVLILTVSLAIRPPSRKSAVLLSLPAIANTLIYSLAPVFHPLVFWFGASYHFVRGPLGGTVYLVNLFYLGLLLVNSIRSFRKDSPGKTIILLFMTFSAVLTAYLEWEVILTGYIDDVIAFCSFLYYVYLSSIYSSRMQKEIAENKVVLAEQKLRLLQDQIRPHFIYNSLAVIRSLIKRDSDKAIKCVDDFSEYLRMNLEAMRTDMLIPFREELKSIKAYIALEQADPTRRVTVHYELKEIDFMLPPLTVQPIVENAFRHGLSKGAKGTIELKSEKDGEDVIVTVKDNGSGFDTDAEKKSGIGMENISERLTLALDGSLKTESDENGTTVTMRIPPPEKSKYPHLIIKENRNEYSYRG